MVGLEKARKRARNAIEGLYEGVARIYTYESKYDKKTHSMKSEEVVYAEDVPCRLSHSSKTSSNQTKNTNIAGEGISLYLSPDIVLEAGCKVDVMQNGVTRIYDCMGVSAVYSTHQEIRLKLESEEA